MNIFQKLLNINNIFIQKYNFFSNFLNKNTISSRYLYSKRRIFHTQNSNLVLKQITVY